MGTMAVKHWFKINNLNFPLAMRGCCSRRARTPCLFRGGGREWRKGRGEGNKEGKAEGVGGEREKGTEEKGRKERREEGERGWQKML